MVPFLLSPINASAIVWLEKWKRLYLNRKKKQPSSLLIVHLHFIICRPIILHFGGQTDEISIYVYDLRPTLSLHRAAGISAGNAPYTGLYLTILPHSEVDITTYNYPVHPVRNENTHEVHNERCYTDDQSDQVQC